MCGRYLLTAPGELLGPTFDVMMPEVSWTARYNITPGTEIPAVCSDASSGRALDFLFWGLLPRWRKPNEAGARMINARSETAAEKPSFREAFREHRCLIPADGFYEWKKVGARKVPQLMRRPDRRIFAMAGIFESRPGADGGVENSGAILTTDANDTLREIHHRMPVVLAPEDWDRWLAPDTSVETLTKLCRPVAEDYFEFMAVSSRVNNPRHDDPMCLDPAGSLRGAEPGAQGDLF